MKKPLCVFPFINVACKNQGQMRVCCVSEDEKSSEQGSNYYLGKQTIGEFWNSPHMNGLRSQMFDNELPEVCSGCARAEAVGEISVRQSYLSPDIREYAERQVEDFLIHGSLSGGPVSFDLNYGNLCNLKCRMCFMGASSQLLKEYERNPDEDWPHEHYQYYDYLKNAEPWYDTETFEADFENHIPNIRRFRAKGGEPFLIPQIGEWIDRAVSEGHARNIEVRFTTNGTKLTNELLEKLNAFKKTKLIFSIDGVEEVFEYIRAPARWSVLTRNIAAAKQHPNIHLSLSYTSQIYNIFAVDRFVAWAQENELPWMNVNLHTPGYFNTAIMPDSLKARALDVLERIPHDPQIQSMRNIMLNGSYDPALWDQFKRITATYDRIRRQSLIQVYPFFTA